MRENYEGFQDHDSEILISSQSLPKHRALCNDSTPGGQVARWHWEVTRAQAKYPVVHLLQGNGPSYSEKAPTASIFE